MAFELNGKQIETFSDLAGAALTELEEKVAKVDAKNYWAWFEVRGAMNTLADYHKQAAEQYEMGLFLIGADELTQRKAAQMNEFEARMGKLIVSIEQKMEIVYARL